MSTISKVILNKLGYELFTEIEELHDGPNSEAVKFTKGNEEYVWKQVKYKKNDKINESIRFFIREIANLVTAENPFVIPLYKWNFFEENESGNDPHYFLCPTVICPYCEKKTLGDQLDQMKKEKEDLEYRFSNQLSQIPKETEIFIETQQYIFAYVIARGMEYLHKNRIIHRDLKNDNIFLKQYGDYCIPLIGDFGYSKVLLDNSGNQSCVCGTFFYQAPEMMITNSNYQYLFPADVYSYAIVLSTILSLNRMPRYHKTITKITAQFQNAIKQGVRPITKNLTEKQIQFLEKLWNHDPKKRLTFSEIVEYLKNPNSKADDFIFDVRKLDQAVIQQVNELYSPKTDSCRETNNHEIIFKNSAKYQTEEDFYRLERSDIEVITRNANNADPNCIDIASLMYRSGHAYETNLSHSLYYANLSENNNVVTETMKTIPICSSSKKDYIQGCIFESQRSYKRAQEFYIKAIKNNSIEAMTKLGLLLMKSNDTENLKKGWYLINKAAELGDREALFNMGIYITEGIKDIGVVANKFKAAEYYIKSARKGKFEGWYQAAFIYHQMAKDAQNKTDKIDFVSKAKELYTKAYFFCEDPQGKELAEQLNNYLSTIH